MKNIYLDHNATTPVRQEVVEAMKPYFTEIFGNASSTHQFGQEARAAVEASREKIAGLLGAQPDEIVFTGCGTESDNLAVKGAVYANEKKGKHIITSSVEHHAVLNVCKFLEKHGYTATYLPVDNYGIVDPADVKKAITKETVLISIMHANNETGTLQPVAEIGKIAKESGVLFHTDAVQAFGKVPVDVNAINADLLSIAGHKFYAPKGIGLLYVRKGTRIQPLLHGGHHEKNRRGGTENVPYIAGLAKAAELVCAGMDAEHERMEALRTLLFEGLKHNIPDIYLNGHPDKRVSNTLNISFEYIEGESIILNLDMEGIAVSSGSACTSGSLESSHVLKAMGVPAARAQGSIRFSLGRDNSAADIDRVVAVLPPIVKKLRAMSPLLKN